MPCAGLASIVAGAVAGVTNITNSATAAGLMDFRDNVTNWDTVAEIHDFVGWNDTQADTSEICTWTGIVCGGVGDTQPLQVNLPDYGLEGQTRHTAAKVAATWPQASLRGAQSPSP